MSTAVAPGRGREIRPRARKFSFPTDASAYWFDGDPFRTRLFDALSTMLPIGERFFIEALRRSEPDIDDPTLREQVRAFVAQEANHQREHRRFNERLRALGYDIDAMDRSQVRVMWQILGLKRKTIPMSVTVAIEHITAVLGASLLRGELFEGCDEEMVAFWRWHAAEEIEHKAVAHDVYTALGGNPHLRRMVMIWAVFIMSVRMASRVSRMLHRDGRLFDTAVVTSGIRFLFGKKGFARSIGPDFLDFFRADFHPWDQDNYELVERWDREQQSRVTER